jgi:hypothetical protein
MEKIINEQNRYIALLEGGKTSHLTRRNSMAPQGSTKENWLMKGKPSSRPIDDLLKKLDEKMGRLS